jgi:cobalt-zinc-cadmium resistance protein CzcA
MPITTGLGEIFQYVLQVKPGYENQYSLSDLRTIQDWVIKKQMTGMKGIVEVSSFGGFLKQYEVSVDPEKLASMNVTVDELLTVLGENNANTGASYMEKGPNALYIRSVGMVASLDEIGNIYIKNLNDIPIYVKDVATEIKFGSAKRFGAMTMNGKGEVVGGITLMLKGADSYATVAKVRERIEKIKKTLPEGIDIVPFIDRASLIDKTINTVSKNLLEGGLIVIFVLVLLLGNFRAGIIVASVIPLSMLFAFGMMHLTGVSANLMSLGALDFGLVVDGAVVIVEGLLHALNHSKFRTKLSQQEMDNSIVDTSGKLMRTAVFGQVIILIVYIPILALVGIEGKMFKPMALTVSFAILGALILSLTYVPMISSIFLSRKIEHKKTFSDRIMNFLDSLFVPTLKWVIRLKYYVIGLSLILFIGSILIFIRLGSVFIPTLEEGDLAMQMSMVPGTSLQQVVKTTTIVEAQLIQHFPEVINVVSKIGTAEVPTDPMGMEDTDIMIILKNKDEWVSAKTREELVDSMKKMLESLPGVSFEFSQPIQLRFNELMTGTKADIAIKIFGDDMNQLFDQANKAASIISGIKGAADIKVEQVEGLPQLIIKPNRQKLALHGISVMDVNRSIRSGFAGEPVSVVYEGEKKFDMVLRFAQKSREDVQVFDRIYLRGHSGQLVPLSALCDITQSKGPMLISRENAQRRIVIGINVRNRDIQSLVNEIQQSLDQKLDLPEGYFVTYGGEFENLQHAKKRLAIAVPIGLLLIFILLFFAFGSLKDAIMIYTAVPLAVIGGIVALFLRGMPFSISAGVGFIALFGVAVLNGIVLIGYFKQLELEGNTNVLKRIIYGTRTRLRPVLMTAAVASLGFIPMAISQSAGGEVQRPLATVVIGGLITSTLLTLILLPIIYLIFSGKKSKPVTAILTILLLISVFTSFAQSPKDTMRLTVNQLLDSAAMYSPQLKNAELDVRIAKSDISSAWNIPNTEFSLQRGQINSSLVDNYFNVSQSLGNIFHHALNTSYLKQRVELMKNFSLQKKQEVKWQIWGMAEELMIADERKKILQKELESMTEMSRITHQRYLASDIDLISKLSVEQQAVKIQHAMLEWEAGYQQILNLLQLYCGIKNPFMIEDQSAELSIESIIQAQENTTDIPMIKNYVLQQELSKKNVAVNASQFAPTFNGAYFNQQLEHISGFQGFFVGVGIPLISPSVYASVKTAKYEVAKSTNELEFQTNKTKNELKNLKLQLFNSKQKLLDYEQKLLDESNEVIKQIQQRYTFGDLDYTGYIIHYQQAISIQYEYLDEKLKFKQLLLAYLFISGKI